MAKPYLETCCKQSVISETIELSHFILRLWGKFYEAGNVSQRLRLLFNYDFAVISFWNVEINFYITFKKCTQ